VSDLKQLIASSPFSYSTDQCHLIDTTGFPVKYKNEANKTINVEAYFNGSIVTYKDKILFCCRADQRPWFDNIRIVFCELDDDFIPKKGTARFLEVGSALEDKGKSGEFRVEDPRLFVCGGRLHIVYGDGFEVYHGVFDESLKIEKWKNITNFSVRIEENDGREKNWCPFDYEGHPHFIYSDNPRVIWCPYRRQAILSDQKLTWDYGQIRGGSPAIPYNGGYLTFFHSAKNAGDREWYHGRLYYMGAYFFEAKPPFRVTHMTKVPIMRGEELYNNPQHPSKVIVVFPAGVIESNDSFFVSLGINDHYTGVIRVSKFTLQNLLVKL
jgi:predicted GH43/DUF377 family glycosyl hydrolase